MTAKPLKEGGDNKMRQVNNVKKMLAKASYRERNDEAKQKAAKAK